MPRGPRYSEVEAREAIAASRSYSEALRRLGMRPAGSNHRTLKRYATEIWSISTDHFDPRAVQRQAISRVPRRCARCGKPFRPGWPAQRHCSQRCGAHSEANRSAKLRLRRRDRPPHDRLVAEIEELGYRAVGRRYGVSDNAIRKWARQYEKERRVSDEPATS